MVKLLLDTELGVEPVKYILKRLLVCAEVLVASAIVFEILVKVFVIAVEEPVIVKSAEVKYVLLIVGVDELL